MVKASSTKTELYPYKTLLGKEYKKIGLSFTRSNILLYKADGYKSETKEIKVSEIAEITYISEKKFFYFILFGIKKYISALAFLNSSGKILCIIPITRIKKGRLHEFLIKLVSKKSSIKTDSATSHFISSGKTIKFIFIDCISVLVWSILPTILILALGFSIVYLFIRSTAFF